MTSNSVETARLLPSAENLSRVVKIAVDSGESPTVEAAYDLFRTYRLGVRVGPEIRESAPHQAALLTIVNIAHRAFLGGVFVEGDVEAPLLVPIPGFDSLNNAIQGLGGKIVAADSNDLPALLLGTVSSPSECPLSLSVVFSDWRGGVIPQCDAVEIPKSKAIIPAAILAGAIAVSEVFQNLRGNPMAGRRVVGMSLWSPVSPDWVHAPSGPINLLLPSRLWLIGLGHLGQAYLWVLGLLPYQKPSEVTLFLQDFDRLATSNESTSLLTNESQIGRLKTRSMADWAEARGFNTRLIERAFPGGIRVADDEPRLALGGVDNPTARAAYEDAGFDWVVEAGLGSGSMEYLALRLHTFPASVTARKKWGNEGTAKESKLVTTAYQDLKEQGMDDCGLVRLATRSVGAPFVGTIAASLVIAEVLRFLNGGRINEVIDMTLRDPASRSVVPASQQLKGFNPGFTL